MSKKGVKMVISAAGMAICLLCGSCGGPGTRESAAGSASLSKGAGLPLSEAFREVREEQEEREIQEAQERAARLEYYRVCDSGTIVEDALTEEETASLFDSSEISDEVFARMDGVSYVENDNIALSELRYLRMLYMGFDGQPHVGEMVVNEQIADAVLEIFRALYDNGYPIEKMRLIDEYGGDDDASCLDNNTSCFNYRVVEGSTHLSRHAFGMAIDINPFYNPYVTWENGVEHSSPPGSEPYADRSWEFPYKIGGEGDLCLELFEEYGFTWGGNWRTLKDYQHFQMDS